MEDAERMMKRMTRWEGMEERWRKNLRTCSLIDHVLDNGEEGG
jgi:hypothetical protein